jgi:pimeloyl-ACP methyl ester carboxylesterase
VDGPITYQNIAGDTIAFLDALGLRAAHLLGFSWLGKPSPPIMAGFKQL